MSFSKIEWTETTWNPLTGCTKISPGCKNCYAERMAKRFGAPQAVMLVHSFSPTREWFQDFEAFALLLRTEAAVNRVVYAGQRGGVHLHIGWICGNEKFLAT